VFVVYVVFCFLILLSLPVQSMRLFGAPLWKWPEVNISGRGCQYVLQNIVNAWKLLLCDGFCVCSNFFCTLRYTGGLVHQRVYVIYDAIIYSKRPLLRLHPLASNNELSAEMTCYVSSGTLNLNTHSVQCNVQLQLPLILMLLLLMMITVVMVGSVCCVL